MVLILGMNAFWIKTGARTKDWIKKLRKLLIKMLKEQNEKTWVRFAVRVYCPPPVNIECK